MRSVPRWPADPPAVDGSGRSYALVSIGPSARGVAAAWADALAGSPLWWRHAETLDGPLRAEFQARLAEAVVGWRLMLCGPEADVEVLRADALAAGAVRAEIRAHATSVRERRVYCAHCRTVGPSPVCAECGRTLTIHEHFSRRHAAYLGVEEP